MLTRLYILCGGFIIKKQPRREASVSNSGEKFVNLMDVMRRDFKQVSGCIVFWLKPIGRWTTSLNQFPGSVLVSFR